MSCIGLKEGRKRIMEILSKTSVSPFALSRVNEIFNFMIYDKSEPIEKKYAYSFDETGNGYFYNLCDAIIHENKIRVDAGKEIITIGSIYYVFRVEYFNPSDFFKCEDLEERIEDNFRDMFDCSGKGRVKRKENFSSDIINSNLKRTIDYCYSCDAPFLLNEDEKKITERDLEGLKK